MSGKGKGKKGQSQKKTQNQNQPTEDPNSTDASTVAESAPPTDAMKNLTVTGPHSPPPPTLVNNTNVNSENKSAALNNGHVSGIGENANIENNDSSADDPSSEQAAADKRNREKKHDAGAADLERVTDYAEETEITESDISGVMGLIGQEVAGRLERERLVLKKIQVKKEDIEILVNEFEISRERAEQVLREHEGSMKKALYTLTE